MVFQNLDKIQERTHYLFTLCVAGSAEIVRSTAFSDKSAVSQELLFFWKAIKSLVGFTAPAKIACICLNLGIQCHLGCPRVSETATWSWQGWHWVCWSRAPCGSWKSGGIADRVLNGIKWHIGTVYTYRQLSSVPGHWHLGPETNGRAESCVTEGTGGKHLRIWNQSKVDIDQELLHQGGGADLLVWGGLSWANAVHDINTATRVFSCRFIVLEVRVNI